MGDRVLLTNERKDVLNGEYGGADVALRNQKSRLRKSSQTTLEELTEIAHSPEIHNRNTMPPEMVGRLIEALITPTMEPEGYEEYRRDLYYHVRRALDHGEELDR